MVSAVQLTAGASAAKRYHRATSGANRGLKQLDRVPGRVVEHNLLPTRSADHLAAEADAATAKPPNPSFDVVPKQGNGIPPARTRLPPIRHGAPRRAGASTEQ